MGKESLKFVQKIYYTVGYGNAKEDCPCDFCEDEQCTVKQPCEAFLLWLKLQEQSQPPTAPPDEPECVE